MLLYSHIYTNENKYIHTYIIYTAHDTYISHATLYTSL